MKVQAVLLQKPRTRERRKVHIHRHSRIRLPDRQSVSPFCFALFGLSTGVWLYCFRQDVLAGAIYDIFERHVVALNASFAVRFMGAMLHSFGAGICIMYLGASPIAAWMILLLLLLRSAAVGLVSAWLMQQFAMQGAVYYFACLFPSAALQLTGLCMLSQRAIRLSVYIKSCLKRDSFSREPVVRSYIAACLPWLFCLLLSALADVLLRQRLSPSFPFSAR